MRLNPEKRKAGQFTLAVLTRRRDGQGRAFAARTTDGRMRDRVALGSGNASEYDLKISSNKDGFASSHANDTAVRSLHRSPTRTQAPLARVIVR